MKRTNTSKRVALITGGSAGLGRELVAALSGAGWSVITDARDGVRLAAATAGLSDVVAIPGDVADPGHRAELAATAVARGRLDLLVHNASTLGPLPMRPLARLDAAAFSAIWSVNVAAPLALTHLVLANLLRHNGILLSVSSDAAVQHYPDWGGYAASKAALDQVTLTLAAENPGLTGYAVDPGDMRTEMHQAAFPGEDISDRPLPGTVVPALLALVESRPPSGRYLAADIRVPSGARGGRVA